MNIRDVKLMESASHLYIFECDKKPYDVASRNGKKTYKHISAKQKIITFTCKELESLCRTIEYHRNEYKKEQEKMVDKILKVVSGYYPVLELASNKLSEIDV